MQFGGIFPVSLPRIIGNALYWWKILLKLFCTSNSVIVNECRMYFNFRLPSEIVPTRSVKVMLKLSHVAEA